MTKSPPNIVREYIYKKQNFASQIKVNSGIKVSKGAKISNQYNQVPHLSQDTNEKVTNSQPDTTNESQEVSPFPAGDHMAHINRRTQRHSNHKTEENIKDPQKKYPFERSVKYFTGGLIPFYGVKPHP